MSCEGYVRNRAIYEIGFDHQEQKNGVQLLFKDDHELLDYLLEQEHQAEQDSAVSFESYTSD